MTRKLFTSLLKFVLLALVVPLCLFVCFTHSALFIDTCLSWRTHYDGVWLVFASHGERTEQRRESFVIYFIKYCEPFTRIKLVVWIFTLDFTRCHGNSGNKKLRTGRDSLCFTPGIALHSVKKKYLPPVALGIPSETSFTPSCFSTAHRRGVCSFLIIKIYIKMQESHQKSASTHTCLCCSQCYTTLHEYTLT